jgi:penicillin amidase
MLVLTAALVLRQTSVPVIERDAFGVPQIHAASVSEAFFDAGYATAEDRLWQMENSRRIARGKMAEAFGAKYVQSDKETLSVSYTDDELDQEYAHLTPEVKSAFDNYVDGVNTYINQATSSGTLPAGYKDNALEVAPWTKEDSLAIGVLLFQQFGRFGAGEIRNMALLAYLESQPKVKDRKLDVLDDFLWENDPKAIPTVYPQDDPVKVRPQIFQPFDRTISMKHLAMLPKVSLFDLLPGLRLSEHEESRAVAMTVAAPFKAGSYALLVSAKKSATGHPLLLSGPQMGFSNPSIVHETSIDAPGIRVDGLDVPGVPGVFVGATPYVSWGLTSGVADTDDVFFYKTVGDDSYQYGTETRKLEKISRTIHVKGAPDQTVIQVRTLHGPVVVTSKAGSVVFVRRPASYLSEMDSVNSIFDLYRARNADDAEKAMSSATMNFNFFYATATDDIGYHYVGRVPLRAGGIDPRFPTPGAPEYEWKGMVPFDEMPHVRNPKGGLVANWNNKPAAWWPNGDAPAWGRVFRNAEVLAAADKTALTPHDVEMVPWTIARRSESFRAFGSYFKRSVSSGSEFLQSQARAYDGTATDGSVGANAYLVWLTALRDEIFVRTTGNFLDPNLFQQAAGPTVMLAALEKRTKVDYLQGRTADQLAKAAWERVVAKLGDATSINFAADGINVLAEPPIPYSNRGSYIQILQMGPWGALGRNIISPGEAQFGAHSKDQVPLARAWLYKPMADLTIKP